MSRKRSASSSDVQKLVRGAAREVLEDAVLELVGSDAKLRSALAGKLQAAIAPPPKRVAEGVALTVGGTGRFDVLSRETLAIVLSHMPSWELLGALGACKGWLALRQEPGTFTALSFRSGRTYTSQRAAGTFPPPLNERCLRKFFTGPRPTFSDAALSTVESLVLEDSTANSTKGTIGYAGWLVVLDAKLPALKTLSMKGRVFKVTTFRRAAKNFGAQLRSWVYHQSGYTGPDFQLVGAFLKSCPRLTSLELPDGMGRGSGGAQMLSCVTRELGAARGGTPVLESLTIASEWRGDGLTWDTFNSLPQKFPELVTLDVADLRLPNANAGALAAFPRLRALTATITVPPGVVSAAPEFSCLAARVCEACPGLERLDLRISGGPCEARPSDDAMLARLRGTVSAVLEAIDAGGSLREVTMRYQLPRMKQDPAAKSYNMSYYDVLPRAADIVSTIGDAPASLERFDLVLEQWLPSTGPGVISDELNALAAAVRAAVTGAAALPRSVRLGLLGKGWRGPNNAGGTNPGRKVTYFPIR